MKTLPSWNRQRRILLEEQMDMVTETKKRDTFIISKLAKLPRLQYEQQRTATARRLGIRTIALDHLVAKELAVEEVKSGGGRGVAKRFITIEEAKTQLSCSRSYIYVLLKTKKINKIKIGKHTLITQDSIDSYLADLLQE
jgi:excisionase family DNA binding protein